MRLARSTGGGVDYWIGLPIQELGLYMQELVTQVEQEHKAMEESAKRGR
jgi:hypothetical protein